MAWFFVWFSAKINKIRLVLAFYVFRIPGVSNLYQPLSPHRISSLSLLL
jgi:hypothetical protein